MRRTGLILLGLALLLVLGRIGLGFLRKPDDAQLIREALTAATKASREGRPGGVLDNISSSASYNGQQVPTDFRQIADTIRKYSPDIKLTSTNATVTGDEARVITPAEVSVGILSARTSIPLGNVTIVLTKEPDHDFLVIPTHRWRVSGIEVPESTSNELLQKLGAFNLGG